MPKRVDRNQAEIVEALRSVGCTVQHLHEVGQGCPDLLVGHADDDGIPRNYLLEVKDGSKPPSKRRLTPDEKRWITLWAGQVAVVRSVDEALAAVGIGVVIVGARRVRAGGGGRN